MFDPEKWAIWHYRATILNDGSNSGNHDYLFTPGAGNICILFGGMLLNSDTAGRNGQVILRNTDGDPIRNVMADSSIGAGNDRQFPTSQLSQNELSASIPPEVVVAGTESLFVRLTSVAVSENSELSLQFLISGGTPTVVLTSPTGATETETENRVV